MLTVPGGTRNPAHLITASVGRGTNERENNEVIKASKL